ncbi:PAS domain S-box [Desulfosporosinus acidiphilus SJ4]|uniref:histidine kinase n=2 Tax=Desulfosporosinus TaxID=79206 RepID=I4D705_DESAJ|nr:PAS domain S-box [Desulfosporosinus acidiphilus SJ4]
MQLNSKILRFESKENKYYSDNVCKALEVQVNLLRCRKMNFFESIFKHSRDIVLLINSNGNIIKANIAAAKAYGYNLQELYNMKIYSLRAPKTKDSVYQQLQEAFDIGISFETRHVRKNGEEFPVEVSAHQLMYNHEKLLLSIIRDVTKRKRTEQVFAETEIIKIIEKVASGLAHEIRNSITSVHGFLQLAAHQKMEQNQFAHHCNLMLEELDYAELVITGLILVAGDKFLDLQVRNLNQLIESMFPLLQTQAKLQGKTIELSLEDTQAIYLDAKEIKLLVTQLTNNALESMSSGGKVIIRTQMIDDSPVLSIRDNGKGIPHEIRDKLGTSFFTTKDIGVGLGLAICNRIVIRHEAIMNIESNGLGTTVNVTFQSKSK